MLTPKRLADWAEILELFATEIGQFTDEWEEYQSLVTDFDRAVFIEETYPALAQAVSEKAAKERRTRPGWPWS